VTLAVIADLRRRFGLRDLEPTTEMTMTEERMALIELVEKQADGDLVREMLEPRRVCRRLISVSYAAMGSVSRAA
jgi:hypothetical protein